ncbi:MAG: pyrroline-5-carboxylate reductase [Verrucomicrobia bacterium]|nr:pyrroline-5-carboxylate reductase [Verrucomicrobiota bacterium]
MRYAFIGAGKMASAIVQGLLRAKVCAASDITAACPESEILQSLKDATSVCVVPSNFDAAAAAPVSILCVKPQECAAALAQAGEALEGKLLVSIAAGLGIDALQKMAPKSRIIRAMPNTAAMVGRSATAFACGKTATHADASEAEAVFGSIGEVYRVEEKLLDAVTGLSGSGPAYVFLMIEALIDGGVSSGLPADLAKQLAVQTVLGAAELAKETAEHPAVLRAMVTSPAGTTAEALAVLEDRGVRGAFANAVRAAVRRSRELSGK